jgi:hypothetical protein
MNKAIDIFERLEKGILNIIKAADIYTLHIIAEYRNNEVDKETINAILKSNRISGFNVVGFLYKDEEIKLLTEHAHIKNIGEQIVFATYTTLEIYLIEKFKEYYQYFLRDKDAAFVENSLKTFAFRSLKDLEKHYYEILTIHLPSFDIEYYSDDKSSFQHKYSWEAICTISKARNEIAHDGESKKYKIVTLLDSWYPFEFVRRWVRFFNDNFDYLIYEGKETRLIKEYKNRLPREFEEHNT